MKRNLKIVCFGEVLWDIFPAGNMLGGAPFNVATHLHLLGCESYIMTGIGKDEEGAKIMDIIAQKGMDPTYIQINDKYSTGEVFVSLDNSGKPNYCIKENVAWDNIERDPILETMIKESCALLYGTLACRNEVSRHTLFSLLEQSRFNICDLNLRQNYFDKSLIEKLLQHAHILKINDEETCILQKLFEIEPDHFYEELVQKFDLDLIIQTLGEKGAEAYFNHRLYQRSGLRVDVKDTVGSGDAFLAAFLSNYFEENSIEMCLEYGCSLGALVASKSGAIPSYTNDELSFLLTLYMSDYVHG